jgi:hypothetical protein
MGKYPGIPKAALSTKKSPYEKPIGTPAAAPAGDRPKALATAKLNRKSGGVIGGD